jgi:predicted ArsR family transcriptional regulator
VTADDLPEDVKQFICAAITSVDQLEVLLLLREDPAKEWSPADVSQALYTQPEAAAMRLADLRARGLVAARADGGPLYRYRPATAELQRAVDRLAEVYRRRRVSVIRAFSKLV